MKTAIIGLPRAGKSTLFRILTHAPAHAASGAREAHVGMAKVPDARLDALSGLYKPKKVVHAAVECMDVAAVGEEAWKESALQVRLREVDVLAHVVRGFEDPSVPRPGPVDPLKDIQSVDLDLVVSDLEQVEKRVERLEKDRRKTKEPSLEQEEQLLGRAKAHLEAGRPLRELSMSLEEKKRIRGFMFLSEKPILHVLNLGEEDAAFVSAPEKKFNIGNIQEKPGTGLAAVCGSIEADLAEMSPEEASEFLATYGLLENGQARIIRRTYEVVGLISFFTVGDNECRVWTVPRGSTALDAAGAVHTDMQKRFIRAEVIRWDELLEAGSDSAARAKGKTRLEGKEYRVQDGDVIRIRHGA